MSEALYTQTLENMEVTVHELAKQVPAPQKVPFSGSFVWRYVEKSTKQAIVQKLARYVSTLKAAHSLMVQGFVQEQAALQRVLDEIQEDATFISLSIIFGKETPLHKEYLGKR